MISQKEFDDAMADLVKAEAEIERLRAEREWRPIKTAPKDTKLRWLSTYRCRRLGFWHLIDERWVDQWGYELTFTPTHWQPLPTPPEDK
jgi:hypothetical protein